MELEPKHLMYGNYVLHNGIIDKICEIGQCNNGFTEKEGYFNFGKNSIEPIPLTEEWVTNFGYKYDEFNIFPFKRFSNENYNLSYVNQEQFKGFVLREDNHFIRGIKYVHQLQNTHFVLKDEQLLIN